MTGPLIVHMPWLKPPLSLNDREHWRAKAGHVRLARDAARWSIRSCRLPRLPAAEVTLCWRVRDWRRHDLDNLAATLKPCIDALVDEGVLPDDDWRFVLAATTRIYPPNPERTSAVWLEICERVPWRPDRPKVSP